MQIIGNVNDARDLAKGVMERTKAVHELSKDIYKEVKILQSSFNDDGYEEVEDIVKKIFNTIDHYIDDVANLKKAMEAYAKILERRN